ncbi:N-acetyltransferase [Paenibacillus nanensis]|uniref:N-acetyltransferase n=1 Tax=Paenibacillus nanensis TaxID=393251 RepID=A0A3A1UYH2_9BACL|nr:acyltransferase [Paenibacillus nanensis]RIX52511.1 N-acetyltransferase [Paenibacillus nanensis]
MEEKISIGQHTVIGSGVTIGEGAVIGNHVVIYDGTIIGKFARIHDRAVIGKLPMKAVNSAATIAGSSLPPAEIGEGAIIGTGAVIYRGARLGKHVFAADLATIRERVEIGDKTIVGRGAAIENDCSIGANCKLETNSYICAFSMLEDDVFIAPCVVTSNDNYMARTEARFGAFKGVTVRRGGRIGANAVILPGRVIEPDGVVAAGSVVTRDVPPRTIVAGNPARKLRDVPPEQWLENQMRRGGGEG